MAHPYDDLQPTDVVLDDLPDAVVATIEARDRQRAALAAANSGLEFAFADLQRWRPGSTVTVAFLGGDSDLHRDIVSATEAITEACDITLDFGYDEETGNYRSWSEDDREYAANIRVSFDHSGYWSLVGTDAVDPSIGRSFDPVGGRPHQRSLNLGGFDSKLPPRWRGTVRHEFLHALAFKHEHQNMRGPCASEFRWEDDQGYVPTLDQRGAYTEDEGGRRPGIYTYLSGYPNYWSKAKVDHNLATKPDPNVTAGPFDPASVMLYRFPALFYRTPDGPCAPTGDGVGLSAGDRRGLQLLYGLRAAEESSYDASLAAVREAVSKPPRHTKLEGLEAAVARHAEEAVHAGFVTALEGLSRRGGMTLPADDSDPVGRERDLERARETWAYDFDALPPLAATKGVPRAARPSMRWFAKVARRLAVVQINELRVRHAWTRRWRGPDVGLESLDAKDGRIGRMLDAIRAAQDAHQTFVDRFAPWDDERPGLESMSAQEVSGDQADELAREVEERIHKVLGPGIQPSEDAGLEGLGRPEGPRGRPEGIEDYARLFRQIPLPEIAETWQQDETFAWLRVAGPNPTLLTGIAELPDNFPLEDALFARVMEGGDSLAAAGAEGRLFLCDYRVVGEVLRPAPYQGVRKYISAPLALFAVPAGGGALRPVAIQCEQTPDAETNPVFTPLDGDRWKLAKAVVQAADGNHHELVSHLGRTHLYVEPFLLATERHLSDRHPIHRLLTPHFEGTVFINNSARGDLIAPGGAIDRIFAGSIDSAKALAAKGVETYSLDVGLLPNQLAAARSDAITDFPYRDDARLLWGAIHRWVESYVTHVYPSDAAVADDVELRAWCEQLQKPVSSGGLPGIPRVETRAALIDVAGHVIFVASCQHSAVNFAQRTDMAYAPAISGAGWRPAPTASDAITDAERLSFMPPLELAREQLEVLNVIGAVHYTRLGEYPSGGIFARSHFEDRTVTRDLLPRFQRELAEIENEISARNADRGRRSRPYRHLLPSLIPMSINI